ncbi:hypothetical protein PTKIN_Ptkin09bG0208800 [Pterospermum kingtungense]
MDIKPSYNCLLGCPWIYTAGVVPSSLHQKIKFIIRNKLVTVCEEKEMIESISSLSPLYVDPPEGVPDYPFKTLEFVNTFKIWWTPHFSSNLHFQVKHLMTKGASIEAELRVNNQGMLFRYQPPF